MIIDKITHHDFTTLVRAEGGKHQLIISASPYEHSPRIALLVVDVKEGGHVEVLYDGMHLVIYDGLSLSDGSPMSSTTIRSS